MFSCEYWAYRKSGTKDPTVGPGTQNPRVRPCGGTLRWDPKMGPGGGTLRWGPTVGGLCNCPKACLKLEVNKTQTFIAPCFSSLYRRHSLYEKQNKILCTHFEWRKSIIYNFWLQTDKDTIFSIKRTRGVFFISERNIECFVSCIVINYFQQKPLFMNFASFF